jgi:hypothetical protein
MYLTQSYMDVPKVIRKQINFVINFDMKPDKSYEEIYKNYKYSHGTT